MGRETLDPLGERLFFLDFWKVDIPWMEITSLYACHALLHIKNTHTHKKDLSTRTLK